MYKVFSIRATVIGTGNYRQTAREGECRCSMRQGGVVDIRIAYPYSLYFSDQLSCIKFFDLKYGLKDINFQSFKHLNYFKKSFLIISFIIYYNIIFKYN